MHSIGYCRVASFRLNCTPFTQQDLGVIALTGAVIGVTSHVLYWSRGLKTPQSSRIFYSHLVIFIIIAASTIKTHGLLPGLLVAWAVCGSYMAGLFTSMTIYRVFFHRLSRFPGPFPGKVSKLYSVWLARNSKLYQEVSDMCDKYGDIVRTGMFSAFMDMWRGVAADPARTHGPGHPLSRSGAAHSRQ